MAKKAVTRRRWTNEEVRVLKSLARERTKTVIARKLRRSVDAMYRLGSTLGPMLGGIGIRTENSPKSHRCALLNSARDTGCDNRL
jgi:hypothetical protein